MAAPEVTVVRARLRAASATTASRRSRVRGALARAELTPEGLPRGAVLIVRRVEVTLDDRVLAPWAATGARAWESAAREQLARAVSAAARPAREPVSTDRPAVLFADRSELVACLLRDAAHGVAADRWWWQGVLSGLPPDDLAAIMRREVLVLPGAFDLLARWGEVAGVLGVVRADEACAVLTCLSQPFALPAAPRRDGPGTRRRGPRASSIPAALDTAPASTASTDPGRGDHALPWADHLPPDAVPATLGLEQATLLATGLLLARRPSVVRTPAFRAVLERPWTAAGPRGQSPTGAPTAEAARLRSRRPAARSGPHGSTPTAPSTGSGAEDRGAPAAAGATEPAPPAGPAATSAHARNAVPPPGEAVGPPSRPAARTDTPQVPGGDAAAGGLAARPPRSVQGAGAGVEPRYERAAGAPAPAPAAVAADAGVDEDGVGTALAGVWYLVNLLPGLTGSSAGPDHAVAAPDALTGWALLEVLARGLLGPGIAATAHDPLWALLAAQDGRDDPEPILRSGVAGPVPDVGADRGVHAAGWWAAQGPGIIVWLRGLLGGGDPAALLHAEGRLVLTRTHLDVLLPLTAVSMPARMAGLDRDPGWVPLLGRVVAFHFHEEVRG